MKESGISKLIRVEQSNDYIDKKGKLWYTFECYLEDGSSILTRRSTEEIELLPGDNIHYHTKFRTAYGNHGNAVKVDDNLTMGNPNSETTIEDVIKKLDNIDTKLDQMWSHINKHDTMIEDVNLTLHELKKAIHFIGKKVHES